MFTALYAGRCSSCDDPIHPGDLVTYNDEDELIGDACCGGVSTSVRDEKVSPARVMPRGRTVADACSQCFQIPAGNGVCGCVA